MRVRPRGRVIGLVVVLGLGAAACGNDDPGGSEPDSSPPPTSEPDNSGDPDDPGDTNGEGNGAAGPPSIVSDAPLEVTEFLQPSVSPSVLAISAWGPVEMGTFEKHGLTVNIVDAVSSRATDLYMTGEFKFGYTLTSTLTTANAVDVPINLYAIERDKYSYQYYVRPEIETIEDLDGQRLGITGLYGNPHLATLRMMEAVGFDSERVVFQQLGGFGDMLAAMLTGELSGAAFSSPVSILAEREGMRPLHNLTEMEIPTVQTVIAGDPAWVAEHPNAAKAWMRAHAEAAWIMHTDPEYTQSLIAERLDLDPEDSDDRTVLERSYEEVIATYRPIPDWGVIGDAELEVVRLESAEPERITDIGAIAPERNLFQELVEEGFLEALEAEYGPLP